MNADKRACKFNRDQKERGKRRLDVYVKMQQDERILKEVGKR